MVKEPVAAILVRRLDALDYAMDILKKDIIDP